MLKKNKPENEFHECEDFDPAAWEVKKKLFNANRYFINLVLFLIGAGGYFSPLPYPAIVKTSWLVLFLILGFCLRIAFEWERVPVLRLGKYKHTKGPGLFFLAPGLDKTIAYVDCRIIVTDFSAERVLTCDAVPVFVDAIIFWMVWDAAKATLEVEQYKKAVALSAKTALRDIIGRNTLSRLLTDREATGKQLQKILDAKTHLWGITSLSVEIKDIVIPSGLEDAMSSEAQAEREKNARVILSRAEVDIAENYAKASEKYENNNKAMELRALNLLLDALKKNGSMILVPSDVPSLMNVAAAAGIAKNMKNEG